MGELAVAGAVFAFAIILMVFLWLRGFKLSARSVNLPFASFDVSKFDQLTLVQLFAAVSRIVLDSGNAVKSNSLSPLFMMNAGWMIVSDAFVSQFNRYPTDAAVKSVVGQLGVQNAELVNVFRDLYQLAIKEGDRLPFDFAESYVTRAPALAQRVLKDTSPLGPFAQNLYDKWRLGDGPIS